MTTRRFLAAVGLSAAILLPSALRAEPETAPAPDAPAQQQAPRGNRENPLRAALAQLELTDAQKAQIEAAFQAERTKLEALRDDTTMTREQKRAQMGTIRTETRTAIEAILTPEQREQIQANTAQRRENRENRGERRGPGQAPAQNQQP